MIDFDVETTSLQWYAGEVFLAAFSDGQRDHNGNLIVELFPIAETRGEGYPPAAIEESREAVQAWLDQDDDYRAWNSKFDLHFLESMGFRLPPQNRWRDGMVEAQLINETIPKALKIRGERLFGKDARDPEVALKAWLAEETKRRRRAHKAAVYDWLEEQGLPQKRNRNPQVPAGLELPGHLAWEPPNYADVPWPIMEPYARQDIVLTRAIGDAYEGKLEQAGLTRVHDEIERPVMGALYDVERRGLPVDEADARSLVAAASSRAEDLHAKCVELAGGKSNFNPASPEQVAQALKRAGADLSFVTDSAKTGKPSMDEENLSAVDHPLADAVLAFRGEQKLMGNYLLPMFRVTYDGDKKKYPFLQDGRIHGSLNQVGARTGRMSSSDPNLQNLPRDDLRLRWCVRAPEGKVLIAADMDQIEARVAAYYMSKYGGGRWLKELRDPDGDLHTSTAQLVGLTGRQRSSGFESPRQQGKRYNYLKMYGGGVRAIRKFLLVPQAHAKQTIERFESAYPEFTMLDDAIQWRLAERGFITTLYGRRQRLGNQMLRDVGYKFLNYLVQGTAGDMFKVAVNRIHAEGVPIVGLFHDEVLAEVDEGDADRVAAIMEGALTNFPEVAQVVPLGAEAQIVHRWSEAKDPDYVPEHEQEAVSV